MNIDKLQIIKLIKEELDSFELETETQEREGSMARSQLYKLAKYSQELLEMFDDQTDLEEWVESKITKAADYIGSVKHYLESSNARSTGALEEAIDREKLVQLAMGIINNMDDSDLEEFINDSENKI